MKPLLRSHPVNILENTLMSGPLKAALLKRITTPESQLGLDTILALREAGLPEEIITKIEGDCHDDA